MVVVGLTGGIGAGKSTVAGMLLDRGAKLVDADQVAREVVEPEGPAYQPLVDRFGTAILDDEGRIDRPRLAAAAFGDPESLADLNAITHPAIGVEMIARRDRYATPGAVVVMDIPLLRAEHRDLLSLAAVIVVDAPPEVALRRLVEQRAMSEEDARARMAAQPTREDRLEGADFVIDNTGDTAHLAGEVERLWAHLAELAAAEVPDPAGGSTVPAPRG
ncbi:MAG: dephospho-CoA kinase [Acidimicrobiales bacterium]|nr:dephospho-CoA kinase [Acidimicrobiales bacterium]